MSFPVEEHARYLADRPRLDAYRRALRQRIKPGDVVVDLGSGTGILGLLACEAGAGRVYCIDDGPMLSVAQRHAQQSRHAERFRFLSGHSSEVSLPEPADLVLADQAGAFGLWAGLLEVFADAQQRFLKHGGTLMPRGLELWIAGVQDQRFKTQVADIAANTAELGITHLRDVLASDYREQRSAPDQLCTTLGRFASIELGSEGPDRLTESLRLMPTSTTTLDGLAGWFRASLTEDVVITNSPFEPERIDRSYLFLPFTGPVQVQKGETLRVTLTTSSRQPFCAWHVERVGATGTSVTLLKQTSLASRLPTRALLTASSEQHRPQLSSRGLLRKSILELCDGRLTLSEIIDAVYEQHQRTLRTRERAAEVVAGTLGRLTQ